MVAFFLVGFFPDSPVGIHFCMTTLGSRTSVRSAHVNPRARTGGTRLGLENLSIIMSVIGWGWIIEETTGCGGR